MRVYRSGHYSIASNRNPNPPVKNNNVLFFYIPAAVGVTAYLANVDPESGEISETLNLAPDGIYCQDGKQYTIRKNQVKMILDHEENARNFVMSRKMANTFRSRALNLYDRSKHKPSTHVLTYPLSLECEPWKDLNRYLSNLRKNYDLNAYCSALEITKNNQYHFHLILDMPFIDARDLNKAWNRAARFPEFSKNAVTGVQLIKSEIAVLSYCSNYLSKKQSKEHTLRKFSYSRNVQGGEYIDIPEQPIPKTAADHQMSFAEFLENPENRILGEKKLEYCTVGRLYLNDHIKDLFAQNPIEKIRRFEENL